MRELMRKLSRQSNEAAIRTGIRLSETRRKTWTATRARVVKWQEGATVVEYAILAALIAAVSIVIISTIGSTINREFEKAVKDFDNATGP